MKRADLVTHQRSLWLALFAGAAAWSAHELVSYAFVRLACSSNFSVLLHLVSVVCIVAAISGAYVAYRQPRSFLASTALALNAFFAFAILMEALPDFAVSPCL